MRAAAEGLRQADFDAATEILQMLTVDGVEPAGDPSMPVVDRGSEDFRSKTADR
jgi:hypothetical protein